MLADCVQPLLITRKTVKLSTAVSAMLVSKAKIQEFLSGFAQDIVQRISVISADSKARIKKFLLYFT